MIKRLSVALALAAAVATVVPSSVAPAVRFEKQWLTISTRNSWVTLRVEVARTGQQQSLGLMHRRSLPRYGGMAFVFDRDVRTAFWMKNTLIPLSIAFYDSTGRILRILDMQPCRDDPCRLYNPGVTYRGALEVNRGAFRRWGVRPGHVITLDGR